VLRAFAGVWGTREHITWSANDPQLLEAVKHGYDKIAPASGFLEHSVNDNCSE
jgi:hypothetical protein